MSDFRLTHNTHHGRRPCNTAINVPILTSGNTLFYTIDSPVKKQRQHKPCVIDPSTGLSIAHLRRTCREQALDYDEHIRQLAAGQKFCGMCRQYKPADEAHFFRRSKSTLGFSSNCKDCEAEAAEAPPTTYDRSASEQQAKDLHEWSASPSRLLHRLRNSKF